MFMGPGPKFMSSINSLLAAQLLGDQGKNSLITTRPWPLKENPIIENSAKQETNRAL